MIELDNEITKIRNQQRIIVDILKNDKLLKSLKLIEKDSLINLLSISGFNELEMCKLHAELEKLSPQGHQEFLETLGFNAKEINEIRTNAKSFSLDC